MFLIHFIVSFPSMNGYKNQSIATFLNISYLNVRRLITLCLFDVSAVDQTTQFFQSSSQTMLSRALLTHCQPSAFLAKCIPAEVLSDSVGST